MPAPTGQPVESNTLITYPNTAQNLLGLSQDIAALLSISIESGASLVHDVYRRTIGTLGWGSNGLSGLQSRAASSSQTGRGMAVVVVGAGEPSGRALSLHLAKTGYTVFAIMPLPSPLSPPTSAALSSLLLSWSRIQKRIKSRNPSHPGAIVPIITDPDVDENFAHLNETKAKGRYSHAGDTIRAYCTDSGLDLVAVVCAARNSRSPINTGLPTPIPSPPRARGRVKFLDDMPLTPPDPPSPSHDVRAPGLAGSDLASMQVPPSRSMIHHSHTLSPGALALTDERTLLSMYRANIVEPLAIIRELQDLLVWTPMSGQGRSRIVFVNAETGIGLGEVDNDLLGHSNMAGATKVIASARTEAAKLLRADMTSLGIDVCEVVVGPMVARIGQLGSHFRRGSDESTESDGDRGRMIVKATDEGDKTMITRKESADDGQLALSQRLATLSRIWAVDDALLFSAVRRAIEDRYPRYRHHAGLSPLVGTIAEITPGAGIIKMIGRWVIRRLFTPRTTTSPRIS